MSATSAAASSASSPSSDRRIGVIIIGCGNVAQALIQQIQIASSLHSTRYNIGFDILALIDSNSFLRNPSFKPLTADQLTEAVKAKQEKKSLGALKGGETGDALKCVNDAHATFSSFITVDVSGSDSTIPALLSTLKHGSSISLANKKPLTASHASFTEMTSPANIHRVRFESTVGAGTPFVAVTRRVIDSGDNINRICGTFSGTLGFVMSGLSAGRKYSEIVQEALQLGYTEPDPRDDLGGVDVARKACILARMLGWKVEMTDIAIEPLFPAELANLPIPQFLSQLHTQDSLYAKKVEEARAQDSVLRYAANIENGKITVGLKVVSTSSPLGRLTGTGNLLELYTQVYGATPLVVQGAGAGGQITAAGILADMIELAGVMKK